MREILMRGIINVRAQFLQIGELMRGYVPGVFWTAGKDVHDPDGFACLVHKAVLQWIHGWTGSGLIHSHSVNSCTE